MIKFFKKLFGICGKRHFKGYGDPCNFTHMKNIFRFYTYAGDKDGYGISECMHCGKRAFVCSGYHLLTTDVTDAIDKFIQYKVEITDVIEVLKKYNYRYKYDPVNTMEKERYGRRRKRNRRKI